MIDRKQDMNKELSYETINISLKTARLEMNLLKRPFEGLWS